MVTHIVLWNLKDKSQKAQQGGENPQGGAHVNDDGTVESEFTDNK